MSLDVLNLKRLPTLKISKLETIPSYMSLCVDFKRASEIAAFGRYSLDTSLRVVNSLAMSIIDYMARKFYPDSKKVDGEIDGQDVSSTLFEELRNINEWLDKVKALHKQADEMDVDDSDTVKDPSYDPEGCTSNTKDDERGNEEPGPSTSGKKSLKSTATTKSRKEKEQKRKDKESDDTNSEPSTATTKPMKQASSSARKKRSAEETTPGSSDLKKAKPAPSEATSEPKKRKSSSHHKKSKCPYCNKEVFDLKRHLRMHAKQEEIEEGEVDKAFNVAVHTTRRRGPQRSGMRKGLPMKWCPVTDCSFVTCHMRQHLANKHRIKAGGYLESLLKVARTYQGKYEVDDLLNTKLKKEPKSINEEWTNVLIASGQRISICSFLPLLWLMQKRSLQMPVTSPF